MASWCTSMTSHIICDITMAFLKYGKYTVKLKLTAQAVRSHANYDDLYCLYV